MKTTQCSLSQVRCAGGANTFYNHNQSLAQEFLIRPVHPDLLVTLNQKNRWRLLNPNTTRSCATKIYMGCSELEKYLI